MLLTAPRAGPLRDDQRLESDETLDAARELHPALNGRFNRIGEIGIDIKDDTKVDDRELPRERLARDHVVNNRECERTDATANRIGIARVVDRANGARQLSRRDR